jgi:hypothetical protein
MGLKMEKNNVRIINSVFLAFVALFVASALAGLQSYPAPLYFCAAALLARSLFYIYKERICELSLY